MAIELTKASGIIVPVKRLYTTTTSYTTSGTSEETAASYTLKGGTMSRDGQTIRIRAFLTTASNGNSKTWALKFGATSVSTRTVTTNNGGIWIECDIDRTSATAQLGTTWNMPATSAGVGAVTTPAETLSGDVVIALTLTTASGAGDLTFRRMIIDFHE